MARKRHRGRDVNGILMFDKPAGMSSNAALQEVKRLYFASKAGHTGSLDPLATGLLPICFGGATRISGFLLDADKGYEVTCKLGEATDTGDAEGQVLRRSDAAGVTEDMITSLLQNRFTGEIEQVPPMHSAVKHQGKRLYDLARRGIEVEREPRKVTVHNIGDIFLEGDLCRFVMRCSKGTYVRTLVDDLGEGLGCGAHVVALRRNAVMPFDEPEMVDLDTLERLRQSDLQAMDRLLLPTESALLGYPEVHLNPDATFYLRQGQPVQVPRAPVSGWVRLYGNDGNFMGMGTIQDDGRVAPKRIFG